MRIIFFLSIATLFATNSIAQESITKNETVTIDIFDLEIPNSPAFVLLDEAPETIQRPNSSRALGLSLLQDVVSDGILNDIAVEVTPFWFSKNRNRSALDFYGIYPDKKQKMFSKLKMVTFSGAYVKSSDSVVNVSLGTRITLIEIKHKDDVDEYYKVFKGIQGTMLDRIHSHNRYDSLLELKGIYVAVLSGTDLDTYRKKRTDWYHSEQNSAEKARDGYAVKMQDVIKRKPLLAFNIAAAYNHRYYNNEFDSNDFGRFGVWGTFVVSPSIEDKNFLSIYVFSRYLIDGDGPPSVITSEDKFNAFDLGIKGELEFNKLAIGYEYVNRTGDLEGYRSAGTIKYRALENIYLTGTFGNNFEEQDDLITLFGIQWGFNNPIQSIGVAK